MKLERVVQFLVRIAPPRLAEDWDNVGLLVGDRREDCRHVMTCLTITPAVVDEAIEGKVDLIVAHHPLPFKPLSRLTTDSHSGMLLWRLIGNGIAVYSAHTAFDSAASGINQAWAELLGLVDVEPLVPFADGQAADLAKQDSTKPDSMPWGAGRLGRLEGDMTIADVTAKAAQAVGATMPRVAGPADHPVRKLAIACGSGGGFLPAAIRAGCDGLLSGEATFHVCLEAEAAGIGLGLIGHYASERFSMERLARLIGAEFADLDVWASVNESDPIKRI